MDSRSYTGLIIRTVVDLESDLRALLGPAVTTDGEHHKQWYLEKIAELLDIRLPEHTAGIAP